MKTGDKIVVKKNLPNGAIQRTPTIVLQIVGDQVQVKPCLGFTDESVFWVSKDQVSLK